MIAPKVAGAVSADCLEEKQKEDETLLVEI